MAYNTGMASWVVHFRIAETLLERIPGLEPEKFALGNVAPDSGKPDARWENFTPPTQLTHFQDPDGPHRDCADLEFFRRYLLPLRPAPDPGPVSFRLGYFFHLVTDNLWSVMIGRPTQEKFAAQFAADQDFIWEVKKDWYGLDFIHLHEHADCIFWRVFRDARPESGGLDFLVPESLAWSVAHIQEYYQRTGGELQKAYNRPCIYLSQAEADRFVEESAERLFRIYRYLWADRSAAEGPASALDLPV
ncbi:MAG: hypothetical protein FD146_1532 [Anaerolineaceae bacterium]|nr:MAG: hypothetical protein FD146_1532 [Anaerolineaceae bacterium]